MMTATEAAQHEPNWFAVTAGADFDQRALAYDLDVDVCVIGGGVAGLTLARELARKNWSVAVLEAQRIGHDAADGGAGLVAPGFAAPVESVIERFGTERARTLWQLSAAGADYVRTASGETAWPSASGGEGCLWVQTVDDPNALRRRVDMLRGFFDADAEAWPAERVRAVLRSKSWFQALHLPTAFRVQPVDLALRLAQEARRAGVRICERTSALAIDAGGIRQRVTTPAGVVRTQHIVLADARAAARLHPPYAGAVTPLSQTLAVTAPLAERLPDAIRFKGAVIPLGGVGRSHGVVAGDRLLWAGPLTTEMSVPRRSAARARRAILRTYPHLGNVAVTHVWAAPADYAVHRLPQIGQFAPGLWLAAAFGHHGIAASAMAGMLIAEAIASGDDRWRLFQSLGLISTGGRPGRVAVGVALRTMRARAWLRERLRSRRHDPAAWEQEPAGAASTSPLAGESLLRT